MSAKALSEKVASLAVDALVDHQLVKREDFELAKKVVSEEIHVRLCLNDYPALPENTGNRKSKDARLGHSVSLSKKFR
jgi:hypothetical protein